MAVRSEWGIMQGLRGAAWWMLLAMFIFLCAAWGRILVATMTYCCDEEFVTCSGCVGWPGNYYNIGTNRATRCKVATVKDIECTEDPMSCAWLSGLYPVYRDSNCTDLYDYRYGPLTVSVPQCTLFYGDDFACAWQ